MWGNTMENYRKLLKFMGNIDENMEEMNRELFELIGLDLEGHLEKLNLECTIASSPRLQTRTTAFPSTGFATSSCCQ